MRRWSNIPRSRGNLHCICTTVPNVARTGRAGTMQSLTIRAGTFDPKWVVRIVGLRFWCGARAGVLSLTLRLSNNVANSAEDTGDTEAVA
jgi:hypothetical protein